MAGRPLVLVRWNVPQMLEEAARMPGRRGSAGGACGFDVNHTIEELPVLVIHAHTRCNCRCVMCDIWKSTENREFTPEQLEAQMPAIERLGVRWVVFTGGEPLMHSDLFALSRRLRAAGVRVTILSTGLLLARFAHEIVAEIDDVIVSLDGPEEIHDRIRRVPGSFRAIADGVAAIHAIQSSYAVAARVYCAEAKSHCAVADCRGCAANRPCVDLLSRGRPWVERIRPHRNLGGRKAGGDRAYGL